MRAQIQLYLTRTVYLLPNDPMKLFLTVCCLLCIVSLPRTVMAQTERLQCVSTHFEPYVIADGRDISGINIELMQRAAASMEIQLDFNIVPWKRVEQDLKYGREMCAVAFFRDPEREQYLDYTTVPIQITTYKLFTHKDYERDDFDSLAEVKGWLIGVNRGFKTFPGFEEAIYNEWVTPVPVNSTKQALDMLAQKRLQAVLTDETVGKYLIKESGTKNLVLMKPDVHIQSAYFVFSKRAKLDHLIPEFDKAIMRLITDGTYKDIIRKYVGSAPQTFMTDTMPE